MRIQKSVALSAILALAVGTAGAQPTEEKFGPFNLDAGKESCKHDTGDEISKVQTYTATGDRFFVDGSITVTEVSGWGKSHSCSITDVQKVPVKAKTDLGEITFMVIKAVTVRAHTDCGSGYGPVARGETISQECTVSAKTMKYTNN